VIITSTSSAETKKIAELLGQSVLQGGNGPLIVALDGDLGAGKTTFIKGLARGLGIRKNITSPTFLMVRRYDIPRSRSNFKNFYHVDAYRMSSARDLETTGLIDALHDKRNIIAVEWADRIKKNLPQKVIRIAIAHQKENERRILFVAKKK
jgi:tRNA threonylcarbamoyladenosine biosynthesis protein TsaE